MERYRPEQDKKKQHEIELYKLPEIKRGFTEYKDVKAKFGPLAHSDTDHAPRTRKDSRFELNPHSKARLSIEDQDKHVIEDKVKARLEVVEAQAIDDGQKRGYADGLKQGKEEAYQEFHQEAIAKLAQLDQVIQGFEGARQAIFAANERYLVELSIRMAKMILLREIKTDPDFVVRLAKHLVERVGVRENIRLQVSPKDLQTAAMIREGLAASFSNLKNISIVENPQIQEGGCMLETDWNAIDASVEKQIEGLFEGLIGVENTVEVPKA